MTNIANHRLGEAGAQLMDEIQSDIDLLRHLGLSEAEAAGFLYRTRQTINQALARTEQGYFKPSDVLALRLAAGHKGSKGVSTEKVARYVAANYGEEAGRQVATAYGQMASAFNADEYAEIFVVLPNASRLQLDWPEHAALLRRLPFEAPGTNFIYLFDSQLEETVYFRGDHGKALDEAVNVYHTTEGLVGTQAVMMVGDPRTGNRPPAFWVATPTGFQRAIVNEPIAISQLAATLPKLVSLPSLPVPKVLTPGGQP